MQNSFKILIHPNESCMHLKLHGVFDGKAAQELLNLLKRRGRNRARVFIHTSSLNGVHAFATALFKNSCKDFLGESPSLIFTGEHAARLAPRGSTRIQ